MLQAPSNSSSKRKIHNSPDNLEAYLNQSYPLHQALLDDRLDIGFYLIENLDQFSLKIDQLNAYGQSPLWIACSRNQNEIAELLMDQGADVNLSDWQQGCSPLHQACYQVNSSLVRLLLHHNAKLEPLDQLQRTPLHYLVLNKKIQEEQKNDVLKVLSRHGVNTQIPLPFNEMLPADKVDQEERDFAQSLRDSRFPPLFYFAMKAVGEQNSESLPRDIQETIPKNSRPQ